MNNSPAALLGRAEFALADASSRASDARSRVAEAHQARVSGDDDSFRRRAAAARRILRDVAESVRKAEEALLALGIDETLREAKSGGPNIRPLKGPRLILNNTRQPDDPGPCVA